MTENKQKPDKNTDFTKSIEQQSKRKIKARKNEYHTIWFGLGMFGLIGWAVMIPTIAGVALGIWIDKSWPSQVSWTLTLMFTGIVLGCLNAWRWIGEERNND